MPAKKKFKAPPLSIEPAAPDWKARSIQALKVAYLPAMKITIERVNGLTSVTFRCSMVEKDTLRIRHVSAHVANILGIKDSPPNNVTVAGMITTAELGERIRDASGLNGLAIYP